MSKKDRAYKAAREIGGNLGAQAELALRRGSEDHELFLRTSGQLLNSTDPRAKEILEGLAGD
jgi:hypothetical protein